MVESRIGGPERVDGIIPIYSVAKVFTAAAALLRFDEDVLIGKLTAVPARVAQLRLAICSLIVRAWATTARGLTTSSGGSAGRRLAARGSA